MNQDGFIDDILESPTSLSGQVAGAGVRQVLWMPKLGSGMKEHILSFVFPRTLQTWHNPAQQYTIE